jgi:hypothetical protein
MVLQDLYWELTLEQVLPPWAEERTTERVRRAVPLPQDLVQALYLDQAENLQSTGQRKELQLR